jgi:hypothetical protein
MTSIFRGVFVRMAFCKSYLVCLRDPADASVKNFVVILDGVLNILTIGLVESDTDDIGYFVIRPEEERVIPKAIS